MIELLTYTVAILLVVLGGYRFVNSRGWAAEPVQWYFCGFVLCMGISFTVLSPSVWAWATPLLSSTATMMVGGGLQTASLSFLALTALWLSTDQYVPRDGQAPSEPGGSRPDRLSREIAVAVGVQVLSCALLVLADPVVRPVGMLLVRGFGRWLLTAYNLLFTCYALRCLTLLTRSILPQARRTGAGPLRFGLRLVIAAIMVGMAWAAWSLDDVYDVLHSGVQGGSDDPVSNLLGACCGALIVAAATSGLWGKGIAKPTLWVRAHRRYRALQPLWSAMYAELPSVALPATRPGAYVWPWEAEFALYRRVIEIRDAALTLRPYAPVADGGEQRAGAAAEAALLAAALDNHRNGRRPGAGTGAGTGAGAVAPARPPQPLPSASIDAEVIRLMQVAEIFRNTRRPPY